MKTIRQATKTNYRSLILGLFVFLIGLSFVLRIAFIQKTRDNAQEKQAEVIKETKREEKENQYTVKKGDTLWKIAQNSYGLGYYAYEIAKANKITNPSLIYAGQILILPKVETKQKTTAVTAEKQSVKEKPAVTSYTVKKGDTLWKIANQVYQDPYQWVKIAKTNKLVDPNLIHKGNVFVIPPL